MRISNFHGLFSCTKMNYGSIRLQVGERRLIWQRLADVKYALSVMVLSENAASTQEDSKQSPGQTREKRGVEGM